MATKTIISIITISMLLCISFVHAQQNIPSDFPEYHDTGDEKADNAAYDEAKKAWVEANPEAYENMGGQIETETEVNEPSTEEEAENCDETDDYTPTIPNNCSTWEITDALIIDENNQLNTNELDEQQAGFKKEMLTRIVLWKLSPDDILYILNDGQYTNHFKFQKTDRYVLLQ